MAFDINQFVKAIPDKFINPALFEVEFTHPALTPNEVQLLKFLCCKAEISYIPGQVIVILTYYLDEDQTIGDAIGHASSLGSGMKITSFYHNGEERQVEEFESTTVFATKVVLDWSLTDEPGKVVVTYEPIPVDKVTNTVYH